MIEMAKKPLRNSMVKTWVALTLPSNGPKDLAALTPKLLIDPREKTSKFLLKLLLAIINNPSTK